MRLTKQFLSHTSLGCWRLYNSSAGHSWVQGHSTNNPENNTFFLSTTEQHLLHLPEAISCHKEVFSPKLPLQRGWAARSSTADPSSSQHSHCKELLSAKNVLQGHPGMNFRHPVAPGGFGLTAAAKPQRNQLTLLSPGINIS